MSGSDTAAGSAKPRFGGSFWLLNTVEMWERLAFYNLRVMAPIYIMQADNPGGLHLTAVDKGTIYAWWAAFQSLLPMVTGGIADRYGFKKTLVFSIATMMTGFLMIALLRDVPFVSNYWGFFSGILVLATGTAFFKPGIQGSLALQMTKENSSVGWGIFYWIVNVGAFVGHYLPTIVLAFSALLPEAFRGAENSKEAWRNLFLASAAFSAVNLATLAFLKDVPSGASQTESIGAVLAKTVKNVLEVRLVAWLLIMSGFWLMMYQLWDLQPNFIADWVDSRRLAETLRVLPAPLYKTLVSQTPRGPMVPQQILLSCNAMFIIVGVVGMSWVTRKLRTLEAMLIGMVFAIVGLLVAGWTQSAAFLVLGILFFSLGEMCTGPKKSEYLALIAPPGKKGLYLGYVNIPVGLGVYAGSKVAGFLYGNYGEKAVLAQKYLAEHTDWGRAKSWSGEVATLEATLGVTRTEAMNKLQSVMSMDSDQATKLLWDTYSPHVWVWVPFAAIGAVSAVALWIFGRMAKRWNDMNA